MLTLFHQIIGSPYYIGNPYLPERVRWVRRDDNHFILAKSDPHRDWSTIAPAKIRLLAELSVKDFAFTADGKYSVDEGHPFSNHAATVFLDRGLDDIVHTLWQPTLSGVCRLEALALSDGGRCVKSTVEGSRIKIQHSLFEVSTLHVPCLSSFTLTVHYFFVSGVHKPKTKATLLIVAICPPCPVSNTLYQPHDLPILVSSAR